MSNALPAPALETRPVIQQLNPLVTYDPYIQKAHSEQMSTFWKICTIAVIAFGIISALLIGVSEGVTLFPLIGCIVAYKFIYDKDVLYDEAVEFNRQLIEHMSYLDPANIQSRLKQLGVTAGHMPLENLKGLMARYRIYEEKRLGSGYRNEAGAYAVVMAYLLKLIENPEEKRPIDGFCVRDYKFDPVRGKIKDKDYYSYTYKIKTHSQTYDLFSLRDKSPVNLSKELFGLNPAPEALEKSSWLPQW